MRRLSLVGASLHHKSTPHHKPGHRRTTRAGMATVMAKQARIHASKGTCRTVGRRGNVHTRAASKRVQAATTATPVEWDQVAQKLDQASPLEIIDYALKTFGDEVAIAFSGAEDVAVIEYAHLTGRPFRVFSLDTGRLNPETYRLFDKVEKRYGIHIEYMFPDTAETEELVRTKGMFSFYEDGHQECCRIRKVRPLRRALRGLSAWITGQRKDQSPGTRAAVPVVQVDPVFDGKDGPGTLIKFNPVSNVTSAETWAFLRTMDVPVNELHSQGYDSIGCEPCTRPVLPNQHEREGRWWWEDATAKECGLHSGNVMESAVDGAKEEAGDLYTSSNVVELSKDEMEKMATSGADISTMAVIYAPWCQFCQGLEPAYEEIASQLQGTGVRVAKFRGDTERDFVAERFQLQTFPRIVFFPKAGAKEFVAYPSDRRDVENLMAFVKALE